MNNQDPKVAVITGAQQGIGFASARLMLAAGYVVIANWLDDEAAVASLAEENDNANLIPVYGDVRNPDHIRDLFDAGVEHGGVDVLVNNAAIFPRKAFLEMTEADWDGVQDVNLKGTFRCSQEFAKRRVDAKKPGCIINLTSGAAFRSSPRGVHYVTSKAGVVGMTRALALELAPHSIRVNAVAPGLTDTAQPRYGMSEDEIHDAAHQNPQGRIAEPEDIAKMIMFLASDDAYHVTGQTLHVNGGQYLA